MTSTLKALSAIAALNIATGAASAQSFTVTFGYTPGAPVEQTYSALEKTAKAACRAEYRRERSMAARAKLGRLCTEQLMDRVVERIDSPELSAHHMDGEVLPNTRRVFAQNN
ncbi:MAG: hypothetical protein AAFZ91_04055 [Pseudomonadota bacterium]